jgi:hypothetical protein
MEIFRKLCLIKMITPNAYLYVNYSYFSNGNLNLDATPKSIGTLRFCENAICTVFCVVG